MHSIARLAPGGQGYYLEQADGRVGHVRSVASGVEDYYLAGPEAAGQWIGAVARELGLEAGEVSEELLDRALSARDLRTGESLEGPVGRRKVPGFDLTFSVPKSASLLWALGDDRVRAAVWRAQRVAVADGLRYLETEAGWGRYGAGGAAGWFQGDGLLGVAFEHRTSRAGDPHIHSDVLVANQVRRPDGTFAAIDSRRLYAEAKTAGFVHEAAFRYELARELGVSWTEPRKGIAEIEGVSAPVRRAFSRRRREIEAYTGVRGATSRAARQIAAYRTRQAKDYEVTPALLAPEWRARADRLGLDRDAITRLLGRNRLRPIAPPRLELEQLVEHVAHFDRRTAIQQAAESARDGARLDTITAAVDRALASPQVVPLLDPSVRREQTIQLRDGRTVSAAGYRPRYSTRTMLITERQLLNAADACRGRDVGRAHPDRVDAALAARPNLGPDQVTMVRRLCSDGDQVQVVIGRAGSGKTHALQAAVEAWAYSGHPVAGAAVSRQAARNLERHAHMPATTIAALLHGTAEIPHRGVLVVDEAGMLPTRDLHQLLTAATERQTKLVLVGDARQLPEIEAGGAFAALGRRLAAIELVQDRRQHDPQRRALLDDLRDGDVATALAGLQRVDDLKFVSTADEASDAVVAGYLASRDECQDALMIALRRTEVTELNRRARTTLTQHGKLGPPQLYVQGVELAVGDQVLLRVNDTRLDAQNGTRGTVTRVDATERSVDLDTGDRRIRLDQCYLERTARDGGPPLAHGYAATAHAAQGATVDEAFVLAGDAIYREWLYVALSRGRHRTVLVAPESALPVGANRRNVDRLAALAARTRAQTMALDHTPAADTAVLLAHRIGPRPAKPGPALRWDQALAAIEAYRHTHTDLSPTVLLGPEPRDASERLRWTVATHAVARASSERDIDMSLER
jgi:conjugative relaxase-like TrwC/TraI family protein